MIDLTPILQALIGLLAALITAKVIPWIKSRTNARQLENIATAARIAVLAAEQIYGSGLGDAKLQYATEALEKMGFSADFDLVRESIEAAVHGLNTNPWAVPAAEEDKTDEAAEEEIEEHAPPDGDGETAE